MKARTILFSLLAMALVILPSCEEGASHATLRVNLRKDRSIVPLDYPLEIDSYRIVGEGPGSESFDIETNKESISLDGLVIGEWTLTAEGRNSNKDVLVTGTTTHRLSTTNGSCTIVLEDLVGSGTLSIELEWDPDRIVSEPSIVLEVTPQYGEKETRTLDLTSMDENAGTASYEGVDYPAGSYVLAARLFDGSVQVAGFVEAVRIVGGETSSGTIVFDLDKFPVEPGTLDLVDNTGVPVSCTISGLEDTVDADIPVTVSISADTDDLGSYMIVWYLDGNQIGEGEEATFTPSAGTHRLDVVASTSRIGTSGSASMNFEAVAITDPGVPSKGNLVESSASVPLAGDTTVRFLPDGNVLIISNAKQKVYIATVIRSSLDFIRTYSFSELSMDGSIVDAAATEVSSTLMKVAVLQEDPEYLIIYNYNPTTASLTMYAKAVPFTYNYPEEAGPASALGSVAFSSGKLRDGCPVGVYSVKEPNSGRWQAVYFSAGTVDVDEMFGPIIVYFGTSVDGPAEPIGRIAGSDESFLLATAEGTAVHMTGAMTSSFGYSTSRYFAPERILPDEQAKLAGRTAYALTSPYAALFLGDYRVMATCTPGQSQNWGWTILEMEPMDHEARSLATTKDFEYAYYIDIDADEIVTLDISADGTSVEEIGRTALPKDGMDTLAVSASGMNIIAYDADNASALAVMRAIR